MTSGINSWTGVQIAVLSTLITRKVFKAKQVFVHEHYTDINQLPTQNDIALVKLTEAVDLHHYTPVCLPSKGQTWEGREGWVYGWGLTQALSVEARKDKQIVMSKTSDVLQEAKKRILVHEECKKKYLIGLTFISEDVVCSSNMHTGF